MSKYYKSVREKWSAKHGACGIFFNATLFINYKRGLTRRVASDTKNNLLELKYYSFVNKKL